MVQIIARVFNKKKIRTSTEYEVRIIFFGRSAEFRTLGLVVPNHARYQLRHTPINIEFWLSLEYGLP